MAKLFESIGKLGLALAIGGGVVNSALFNGGCWSVGYLHNFKDCGGYFNFNLTSDCYVLDVNATALKPTSLSLFSE